MSSKYISLFKHWQKAIESNEQIDEIIQVFISDLKRVKEHLGNVICIQDYRDFLIPYISDGVFDLTVYYFENFYNQEIELGLSIIHLDYRLKILVFQKTAFEFIQKVSLYRRKTIRISYQAKVKKRNE